MTQREGETQYMKGKNNKPKKVEIQLRGSEKILDEGSKILNNLAIIFKIFRISELYLWLNLIDNKSLKNIELLIPKLNLTKTLHIN